MLKTNKPFKQKCKNSGLPNFSKSQLSNSNFPGAYGSNKLFFNDLNLKVTWTLTYSQIPSLVYSLNYVVSPILKEFWFITFINK